MPAVRSERPRAEGNNWTLNSLAIQPNSGILIAPTRLDAHLVCRSYVLMESLSDHSSSSDDRTPARRPEGGKLTRIATHTQGLVEDLREWIDLRLDLTVLEIEEKVDTAQNQIALGVVFALLGFFAGLFTLTTVALGLGWLFGHPFFGFLAVSVVLLVLLAVLRASKPELVPPSGLFETLRGASDDPDDSEERPTRDVKADVQNGADDRPSG